MIKRVIKTATIFAAGFALCAVINGKNPVSLAKGILRPATPTTPAQASSPPQLWEYRVVTKYDQGGGVWNDYGLNALAAQGFEVIGMSQSGAAPPNSGYHLTILLRRPKK